MDTPQQNKGFTVRVVYADDSPYALNGVTEETFEHITEIHYNYPTLGNEPSIAFESDIEATGCTRFIRWVKEFEAIL